MTDPVLFLHRLRGTSRVFDTSSVQSPGSIRDQILRACWLVDRALDAKYINKHSALLVLGAGVAGVSAAMRAAAKGVPTILVDQARQPFSRQATCQTRWVDPSIYEWPHGHHTALAWGTGSMPLPYRADLVHLVVSGQWVPLFNAAPGYLTTYWGHVMKKRPKQIPGAVIAEIENTKTGKVKPVRAAMALIASGAPEENTECLSFRGFRFWDSDPYGQPSVLSPPAQPKVLISGGGDGALQDLLRIVLDPITVPTPRHLLPLLSLVPDSLLLELQTEEDQAQRTLFWNGGARAIAHDHPVHIRLHGAYRMAARRVITDPRFATTLEGLLRPSVPDITFLHSCEHLSRCYPLNHFMGALLIELLTARGSLRHIRGHRVESVSPSPGAVHACGHPSLCHGMDHEIGVAPQVCGAARGSVRNLGTYNVVILRHGPVRAPGRQPAVLPIRRQLVPYGLP